MRGVHITELVWAAIRRSIGPQPAEWGFNKLSVSLSQRAGMHCRSPVRPDMLRSPPGTESVGVVVVRGRGGRRAEHAIQCLLSLVAVKGPAAGCPRAVRWAERAVVAAPQDEGPVMVTEAEEVTDQLRTQARAAHTP